MTDRDNRIYERLKHDVKYVKNLGYEVFGVFLQGSQNYRLDYEGSDIDTKCIVIPTLKDIVLNKKPVSTTLILEDNSHIDVKDIRLMWECFRKQNINFLEILFTDYFNVPYKYGKYWFKMLDINEEIAHYNNYAAVNCIAGMVFEKNAALCHPYPTLKDKIEKHGYDNKQLHHIVRCAEFLDRYIEGVPYAECLIPTNPQQLVDIKASYIYNLDEAKQIAKETVDTVKAVKELYMEQHKCVINNEVKEKMDEILTDVIWESLVEDFYG